jgi:hypothetical protein
VTAITAYVHRHAGRAAVIVGGGESVLDVFGGGSGHRPPRDGLYISANAHGCKLSDTGMAPRPDYLVCMDKRMGETLRPYGIPIVSTREFADVALFENPLRSSGMLAAYVAWIMGCAPIVLCGMDCYTGGTYFHDATARSTGGQLPLARQVERWRQLLVVAPGGMFRSTGGPLARHFPAYDRWEAPCPLAYAAAVRAQVAGWQVRITRVPPGKSPYRVGEQREVSPREARRLIKQGHAERA